MNDLEVKYENLLYDLKDTIYELLENYNCDVINGFDTGVYINSIYLEKLLELYNLYSVDKLYFKKELCVKKVLDNES